MYNRKKCIFKYRRKELDISVNNVYAHNITLVLERLLHANSYSEMESKGVLDNVKFDFKSDEEYPDQDRGREERKREGSKETSRCGWDAFYLYYHVPPPLDAIFTPDVTALHDKVIRMGIWDGTERDGLIMGWDGMDGMDGMGWDGMGWDGMGWDGMGWDGMGWDGMGWDGMGWDAEDEDEDLAIRIVTYY
jgi:hypothetical protein